jgi:hypothetical protein
MKLVYIFIMMEFLLKMSKLSNFDIQSILAAKGFYVGTIDGIIGPKTKAAARRVLAVREHELQNYITLPLERKLIASVQLLLRFSGFTEVGKVDGYEGMMTQYAYSLWKEKEIFGFNAQKTRLDEQSSETVPSERWGTQAQMEEYFGEAGGNQCTSGLVQLPFKMKLAWDKQTEISKIRCHEKIAESVQIVFEDIASKYSQTEIETHGFDIYGGCFNYRKKRGGSTLSTHAYGIAIDIDPERNALSMNHTKAYLAKAECDKFWDCWENQGFTSLGRAKDFDWMHVQAPSV